MKNIKVYLQYPWKFPDSPYYKYLVESPPEGVEFLNTKNQKGVITNKRFFWFSNFLKKNIRKFAKRLNLAIPNAHKSPEGNYDLIHCAHCLSKNEDKPWVADIEMMPSLAISGWKNKKGIRKINEILKRDNCKKIMPWTKGLTKEILESFPEIKNKVELVYPAIPEIKNLKKPNNKKLKIIFVARYFYIKGGLIALEVLEQLRKKYGIEGIVVSNVPKKIKKKYPNLKIHSLLPQKKLFDLMIKSNILLYPSAVDTFGFSLLESMSFGLPIVTINTYLTRSRKEIIENGKEGFVIDVDGKINYKKIGHFEKKLINELFKKTSLLIEKKDLRKKMSKNCLDKIKKGKFSIKERNKKLKRIYSEAIK